MPELPEVEAWRRQLDPLVKRSPIVKAGPAHIATLKTFDPPLSSLDGEGFRGVERRAKRFLLPTDDDELVVMVHLMSAGRLKYVASGAKGAKTPAFRLRFVDGGELQLTEAGAKKRAGVWLLRPEQVREELAHLGPEADSLTVEDVARILASDSRRLHSLLRDQRLIAGIGRAWANEILWSARLSPYALSTQVDEEESHGSRQRSTTSLRAGSSCASRAPTTRRPIASTTSSGSHASAAARRSRASTSRSTRSTTARPARPTGACSRTAGSRDCSSEALGVRWAHAGGSRQRARSVGRTPSTRSR